MKIFSLLMIFASIFSSHAHAVNSINVQTFNPSVSDHFVLLEDGYASEWPKNAKMYFGANYNYSSEPLVALVTNTGARAYNIVDSVQTLDLMVGFKASARFGLFFGFPIHFIRYPDVTSLSITAHNATGLGDFKILGKVRITNDESDTNLALVPEIHLPTGNTENFVSDASTYFGVRLAIERKFTKFTLLGNIGFAAASNSIYQSTVFISPIDYRQRFIFGIGGFMPFNDRWGMNVEFNSIHMVPFDKNVNPNELYAGLRHVAADNLIFTLGGSIGKIGGSSGQNYRIIAGLRFNLYGDDEQNLRAEKLVASTSNKPITAPAPRAIMRAKKIELLTQVNFKENSSLLTPDGKDLLDEVAGVMANNIHSFKKIQIDGHTNNNGTAKTNLWLSLERARSVKNYLIGKGVPAEKLEARGFGQNKPEVPYTNKNALQINRRVEFNVVND